MSDYNQTYIIQTSESYIADNYVTGTTIDGGLIYFNRTNGMSAFTADLSSIIVFTKTSTFNSHTGNTSNPHQTSFTNLTSTGHTHTISDITDFPINVSYFTNDVGYITGATSTADDYVTGSTFNTATGTLTSTRLSGGTFTQNLDGRYLTGFTIPSTYLESGDNISELTNDVGYITGFTDTDTNDYVTSAGFNTTSGLLTLTRLSGGTVNQNLDGRYSLTSHTHAQYLTGYTDTNDYVTGSTFNSEILTFTRLSGGTFQVDLSNIYTLTGHTHNISEITDFPINVSYFTNDIGYITGFTIPSTYLESGDNISELINNIGYITGFTDTNANDYVTGSTFNVGSGLLTLTRLSGGTFNVNLDGRYANSNSLSAYTTSTLFNSHTGNTSNPHQTSFTNLTSTGHTHNISQITGFVDNSTNWNSAYNDVITGMTVTGSGNKTITLQQRDGGNLTANFTDLSGGGAADVVTGMTFSTVTGNLSLQTISGSTYTQNLDGRYSLTGHTHTISNITDFPINVSYFANDVGYITGFTDTDTNDYVTGSTFNTANGTLTSTRLSGGTVNVNLDGRYLTGFTIPSTYLESGDNISELTNDVGYITGFTIPSTYLESGDNISELTNDVGYITGFTDTDTNDYVTGSTFNTANGNLTLTRLSGGTVNQNLDGRYSLTGHTHSQYLTEYTPPIATSTVSGTVKLFSDTVQSISASAVSSTGSRTYGIQNNGSGQNVVNVPWVDTNSYVSNVILSITTLVFTGINGAYNGSVNLAPVAPYLFNGLSFDSSTGVLSGLRLGQASFTTNLDGRYALNTSLNNYVSTTIFDSHTGNTSNPHQTSFANLTSTGHTHTISNITDFTDNSTNWNSSYDDAITGLTVTGSGTKTISLFQRDGGILTANFTDLTGGGGGSADVVTGMTFNIVNGDLSLQTISGSTFTQNLDGRYSLTGHTHTQYLTGYTDTNDYVTGSAFNTASGLLSFSRLSGGTFNVNLDGRYANSNSLSAYTTSTLFNSHTGNTSNPHQTSFANLTSTGHTHTIANISNFPSNVSYFNNDVGYITGFTDTDTNDYVTGSAFNTGTGVLTSTRLSGGTFNVNLDGRYANISSLSAYTTNTLFNSHTGNTSNPHQTSFANLLSTGHTHNISDISNFTDNSTNWNSAYNDVITGMTVTGSGTKTISLFQRDGGTVTTNFTDLSGGGAADVVTGMTFNNGTGDLSLQTISGSTLTQNLDGRYSLTGHTHTVANITDFPTSNSGFTNDVGYITGFTDTNTTYSSGAGLDLTGTVFSHSDTSTQASSNNSGRTYIQDIFLDTFGHITGLTTSTETVVNTDTTYSAATSTVNGTTKLFSDTVQTTASNGVSSTTARTYGIQNNGSGQMVVNVPWVDNNTTYSEITDANLQSIASSTVGLITGRRIENWANNRLLTTSNIANWNSAYNDVITGMTVTGSDTKTITLQQRDGGTVTTNFTDLTGASGTVTNVSAITLGTTGTDLSSSVVNSTTTPVITLNIPTASATNRGVLSSANWTTFNNKQSTLVSGTNIKTVNGDSLLGSGDLISTTYTVNTGSVVNLGFLDGNYCNNLSANANTAYTLTNVRTGGWVDILINAASEPTLPAGAIKDLNGDDFVSNTNMRLIIYNNGTTTRYYFQSLTATSGGSALQPTKTTNTGSVINLSNFLGNACNMASANSATTYTLTGSVDFGNATILINAATQPIVSTATLINGSTFIASTNMYMKVWNNSNRVEYWFEQIAP